MIFVVKISSIYMRIFIFWFLIFRSKKEEKRWEKQKARIFFGNSQFSAKKLLWYLLFFRDTREYKGRNYLRTKFARNIFSWNSLLQISLKSAKINFAKSLKHFVHKNYFHVFTGKNLFSFTLHINKNLVFHKNVIP